MVAAVSGTGVGALLTELVPLLDASTERLALVLACGSMSMAIQCHAERARARRREDER